MKRMFKIILIIALIPLLYVVGNIVFAILTKFSPAPIETVAVEGSGSNAPIADSTLTFMTWNVGYGGLGAETDFFYDDGKMVITPKNLVEKYTHEIFSFMKENKTTDFILLQEVDRKGKRSYDIDEYKNIATNLPDHATAFALNYDVKNLPFPWTEPLGRIYGGLMSTSRFKPTDSKRYALSGITDFPKKLFYLERCLLVQKFPLQNGKELVVVNTHFEAYDDGGIKKQQMAETKKIVMAEYAKGNYVVIGGDWNIAPPSFDVKKWEKEKNTDVLYELKNDPDYIAGWQYAFDGNTPSNRKNNHAFNENTFTTVIDYFYVSPNIEIVAVNGVDAGFKFSDHNPVKMTIKLK